MERIINHLNAFAALAMRRSEIVAACAVIAIVFMMITPLPTELVDVLIAVNICIASLLIMLALQLPRPLAFSTLPAVLLLTTLFRLALSISTTRLILLDQDAGHIVEAFGQFVVGGNLAVGMVIFLILTVVNFLVITKGSERVAEVGARFSLDAMPGKQMSIDSDLRANLITIDEARRRRNELARESQLFGAMDGAMKFVNGDAIAGLIIVAINLIGGISIGVIQHGMVMGDAVNVYSVLTIGDGLIAQIPALLISVTCGIIITRVPDNAVGGEANIGREIAGQLTSQPKAWVIASGAMLGFAALPGMPTAVFIMIAIVTGGGGALQLRLRAREAAVEKAREAGGGDDSHDLSTFVPTRPLTLQFSEAQPQALVDEVVAHLRKRRNRLVVDFGLSLPGLFVQRSATLAADEFHFQIYEVPVLKATLNPGLVAIETLYFNGPPEETVQGSADRGEADLLWVPAQSAAHLAHEALAHGCIELIGDRVQRTLQTNAGQFLGIQECKAIIDWLETQQPDVAKELARVVPLSKLASVFQRLASECVPLRSVRVIAETLIEYAQFERETSLLVDYVRIALRNTIHHQNSGPLGMQAWLMTPEAEKILRLSLRQTQTESYFSLEGDLNLQLIEQLESAFPPRSKEKTVLLVAQDLRGPLRALLQSEFFHVPVMTFAEVLDPVKASVLGRIDLYSDDEFASEAAA